MPVQAPSLTSRARAMFCTVRGYWPLTWTGVLLVGVSWFGLRVWGEGQTDFLVRGAAYSGAFILVAASAFVLVGTFITLHRLKRMTRESQPLVVQADTGSRLLTGFELPRLRWWPFLRISIRWICPESVEVGLEKHRGIWRESVRFDRRGRHQRVKRMITVTDVFGLAAMDIPLTQPASLFVQPKSLDLLTQPDLRRAEGDGISHPQGEPVGDYVEMRRYAPGDPLRLVVWKAYARSRRLLVRTPERAVSVQPSTAAYFVAGRGDEQSASVARSMLEAGHLGRDLIFGADGAEGVIRGTKDALGAIVDSAGINGRGGRDFKQFVASVNANHLSRCIVFVPDSDGPWRERIAEGLAGLPAPPLFIIGVDGRFVRSIRGGFGFLWRPDDDAVNGERLTTVCEGLQDLGSPIQVIHTSEGRTVTAAELEALRRAS